MKSLLLGDRADFYGDKALYIALSRSGIMHVVAVSGMHIAFLVGFVQLLFGKTKKSSVFCIALIWGFTALAGFPFSAVRAAIMQTILLLAPIFKRETDSLRSLLAAFVLIEIISPKAILDTGFQLSFGAMAGLLLFSNRIYEKLHSDSRVVQYFAGILASSLSCMVFTVPLSAWHFGSIQLLSPLTNLLVLPAVTLCFCGGWISVLLGLLLRPLGALAAEPVTYVAKYIIGAAKLISRIPFACLYTKNSLALVWVVLVYLLVFLALWKKLNWKIPCGISLALLALLLVGTKLFYCAVPGVFSVIDVGQGQSIAVMQGNKTVMIDCGGDYKAGSNAGEYLRSCGRRDVDILLLTHLHADHMNGVETLLQYIKVHEIVIPEYGDNNPDYLNKIRSLCSEYGILFTEVGIDSYANIGGIHISMFPPFYADSANEACLMNVVSIGDYDMLVTGDAGISQEKSLIQTHEIKNIDLLIVGHHGSKNSSGNEFLQSIGARTAVISVGENDYGHPTVDALNRLKMAGYEIKRTDLLGTVELILK